MLTILLKNRLLLLMFFLSVNLNAVTDDDLAKWEKEEKIISKVQRKIAKELKKEKKLYICGFGGRGVSGINNFALFFKYYKDINEEEKKNLLIYSIKKILKKINENKEIRPYLENYPFDIKGVEVTIEFCPNLFRILFPKEDKNDTNLISFYRNKIEYFHMDNRAYNECIIKTETYP